jgi:uncharacterized OB-fold protein
MTRLNPPPEALFAPETDRWTAPYWEGLVARRLTVPRCAACGTFRMPPTPVCPACRSSALDWPEAGPEGRLYTWTLVTRAILPGMEGAVPYAPAVVELPSAGSVRLVTCLIDADPAALRLGQPLRLRWHRRSDGLQLPLFAPA